MSDQVSLAGKKILIVDDHKNIRISLRMTLEAEGAEISEAASYKDALVLLGGLGTPLLEIDFDCILLDIRLPDGSGIDILKALSKTGHSSRIIMISGEGTAQEAFKATQLGAFDYIEKPFTPERIIVSVGRCVGFNQIQIDNTKLKQKLAGGHEILGSSQAITELQAIIKRVAPTNGRVLIIGESGTGKELVAKAIHRHSQRSHEPLIKINCAAIPSSLIESELFGHEKGAFTGAHKMRKGVFERANGATLFLDEIGELDLTVQAKLLRVLQSGELTRVGGEAAITVDVRLVAATNRDLKEMVAHNEFREDLYYRLNVVTLFVPPLRDRAEDIKTLAAVFLAEACEEHALGEKAFSEEALQKLTAYKWPGNVRELKNYIERLAILSEETQIKTLESFAGEVVSSSDQEDSSLEGEFKYGCNLMGWQDFHQGAGKSYIKFVLRKAGGNVSEAARLLCLERAYLHRLMRKLGVQRDIVVQ